MLWNCSSRVELFCKKGVLRKFAKFAGKHQYQSLFLIKLQTSGQQPHVCNLIKKETVAQLFSCEFCEISKNIFLHRTLLVTASVKNMSQNSHLRCSLKIGVLKNLADLRPATLVKQRLWHSCFPVNVAKFLRTPFLQKTASEDFREVLLDVRGSYESKTVGNEFLRKILIVGKKLLQNAFFGGLYQKSNSMMCPFYSKNGAYQCPLWFCESCMPLK